VMSNDRYLQDHAGARADRQERRIRLRALFTQRRQHDLHDGVESLQDAHEDRVETAGQVTCRRRHELIFETELVEERAQARVGVRSCSWHYLTRAADSRNRSLRRQMAAGPICSERTRRRQSRLSPALRTSARATVSESRNPPGLMARSAAP